MTLHFRGETADRCSAITLYRALDNALYDTEANNALYNKQSQMLL